ncbi:hypothetical protein OSB04_008507 [Centaurea solstitialis]|uniref:Bulb-type lectin domain-containing protein n=1 Tax=Centaurea solstitialis TaxID=347529 RepID=A0AA38WJK2_9ASTR|nr:hypothetical protein OSB04_008507 [Centaurea solstitialis]
MRTILQPNGLWEMIEPTDQTKEDDKRDKIATAYLFQALPEDLNLQVANCKSAKEVWATLNTRNIGVDQVQKAKLQTLRSEFEALEMNEEDSFDSFILKMTNVISKITSLGTTFNQPTLVRKLLNSMPDKYLQIVAAIEQYSDLDTLTLDEAIGRLKTFEERLKYKKNRLPYYQEGLMFAQREDQRKAKYVPPHIRNHGNIKQHEKEENPSQDNNEAVKHPEHRNNFTRDFSNIKCYNCNKYGHYASHCCERSRRYQRQELSNLIEEDLEPTLLMATIEEQEIQHWEANRGRPIQENAALSFGSDGNLVLTDADGRIAWQTNTANKGVVGCAILPNGNIVLRDAAGRFVWQSFDSPTDTLLFGQSLRVRGPNKLVSSASVTENVDGVYNFVLEPKRLALYYKTTMRYWSSSFAEADKADVNFVNATLQIARAEYSDGNYNALRCRLSNSFDQPRFLLGTNRYNSTFSYLRLGIDGNLRPYGYRIDANAAVWSLLFTWFNREWTNSLLGIEDECQLPDRCGKFGLCEDRQCVGCPTPKGVFAWSKDCAAKLPRCCQASGFRYYKLKGVDHFTVKYSSGTGPVDRKGCESKCTKDCKCLGYFYRTDQLRCWIAYELKTLTRVGNSTHMAYIKTLVK